MKKACHKQKKIEKSQRPAKFSGVPKTSRESRAAGWYKPGQMSESVRPAWLYF